jgi:hypothetical protein
MKRALVIFTFFALLLTLSAFGQELRARSDKDNIAVVLNAANEVAETRSANYFKENHIDLAWQEYPISCACDYCPDIYCHDEISEELKWDISDLWYGPVLGDFCYKATQKNGDILIARYFYTDFSFKKVKPRLFRALIVFPLGGIDRAQFISKFKELGALDIEHNGTIKMGFYIKEKTSLNYKKVSIVFFKNQKKVAIVLDNKKLIDKAKKCDSRKHNFSKDLQSKYLKEALLEMKVLDVQDILGTMPDMDRLTYGQRRDYAAKLLEAAPRGTTKDSAVPPLLFIVSSCLDYEDADPGLRFGVLKELIDKYPNSKWGERAFITYAELGFGECDGDCVFYDKIISSFPDFIKTCKDNDARLSAMVDLGKAYETRWACRRGINGNNNDSLPSPDQCRRNAIKTYKKAIALDKEGHYAYYLGRVLPKLYLNVRTGASFFIFEEGC